MNLPPDLTQAIREEIRSAVWTYPPRASDDWPHDIAAERHVLSSLFDSDDSHGLRPEDFFAPIHQRLFALMQGTPVADRITTVLQALKSDAWRAEHIDAAAEVFVSVPIQVGKPLRESIATVANCAARRRGIHAARQAIVVLTTHDHVDTAHELLLIAAQSVDRGTGK